MTAPSPRFQLLMTVIDAIEIVENAVNEMADENSGTIIRVDGHEWTLGQWRDALKHHLRNMLTKLKDA